MSAEKNPTLWRDTLVYRDLVLHQALSFVQMVGGLLVLGSVWIGQSENSRSRETQ